MRLESVMKIYARRPHKSANERRYPIYFPPGNLPDGYFIPG